MSEEFFFYTKGLTVGYGGVPLIKDIEIRIRRGEILTLIGPNGSGKTTILRSLIRQLKPLTGVVYLDGKNIAIQSGRELARNLSIVLTDRVRPERMTCCEVVETGRYPYTGRLGRLSAEDRRIVQEAMELVHVTELAGKDFTRISDGQRQRVMLARALSQEPELIVLDEPTSFLDIRHKLEFLSLLQELSRKRNLSVILSLHELELAERVSDKLVCIQKDRIDRLGTPEEIFVSGYIQQLYQIHTGVEKTCGGTPELPSVKGIPEVFVLAGNGRGTPVYRRLQRQGIPFVTGILWENDQDYPVARQLAVEVVAEPAFYRIRESSVARAKELMTGCREIICALKPELGGELYPELKELWEYGRQLGKT